ncbi:uncharacterized protein LOC118822905 [Colossoma macropomum]|uniref:uncharacterized protein LOC118822905 n=1 Tax=Colossoma macropomum TaxID=42526 RepID=UPI001864B3D8|nr:uncharacterized protein LOC118822905 [Colossoma macropomum]
MKLQVTLALISVLLPQALALQCYICIPDLSGTCTKTQKDCPDQCGSKTTVTNVGGQQQEFNWNYCTVASECVNGSINLGLLKMAFNSKCCSTDLCNSQLVPALPQGSPNGKRCCADKHCTRTMSCEGDEDHCVSATATAGGVQVTMKGCASRGFCTAHPSDIEEAGIAGDVSCCEGDLCNSAERVKLSLLIMLVPLISSILFIPAFITFHYIKLSHPPTMRLQVTLLLVCMLFPEALTLKCYQCLPGLSGKCTDTQTDCPDQCASRTTTVYVGGVQTGDITVKSCAVAGQCVTGSRNLGLVKTTVNSKCCSSNLCNSYKAPVLPKGSPNGRKCYTCTDDDCSRTVNCEGDEDQCISARVHSGGAQVLMKGCASRSLCTADKWSTQAAGVTEDVTCCEGNLCNSAEGVKLSLLIMLVPLISSILFI